MLISLFSSIYRINWALAHTNLCIIFIIIIFFIMNIMNSLTLYSLYMLNWITNNNKWNILLLPDLDAA